MCCSTPATPDDYLRIRVQRIIALLYRIRNSSIFFCQYIIRYKLELQVEQIAINIYPPLELVI